MGVRDKTGDQFPPQIIQEFTQRTGYISDQSETVHLVPLTWSAGHFDILPECGCSMGRRAWLVALAGAVITAAVYFYPPRRLIPAPAQQGGAGYVDAAVCAGCHQEIAKTYRLTGMGRSAYHPRPENTVEDYKTHNSFH